MRKRILLIYGIIVLALSLYFSYTIISIDQSIYQDKHVIAIDSFMYKGQDTYFNEKKIEGKSSNHIYYKTIPGEELLQLKSDMSLIVTRLRGNWHQVYFNDILVGEIGSKHFDSSHVWNDIYKFSIDKSLIKDSNDLKFITHSEYKIGFGTVPILLTAEDIGHKIYTDMQGIYSRFYISAISAIVAISIMVIVLFISSDSIKKEYGLMPFSALAASLYLFDYTNITYAPLSPLLFKKLMIILLYTAVLLLSISISRLYKKAWLTKFAYVSYALPVALFMTAQSIVSLSNIYGLTNLLILLNVSIWLVITIHETMRNKTSDNVMLLLANLLLIIPAVMDTLTLLRERGWNFRLLVYGIIFYSIAGLMYSFTAYIDEQKMLYHQSEQLIRDKVRLEKALVTDELTDLKNKRALLENTNLQASGYLSFIHLEIDKFNAFISTFGHHIGDQIILLITEILKENVVDADRIFRISDSEFILFINKNKIDAREFAIEIQHAITGDTRLDELCEYYPITILGGVATYPEDGSDIKGVVRNAMKATEFTRISGYSKIRSYVRGMEEKIESQAHQKLKYDLLTDFVITLAGAIDLKDMYTGKHSEQVSKYSLKIAEAIQLDEDLLRPLRMGSLLHDLGKIAISDDILRKPSRLTEDEFEEIKTHTLLGSKLIEGIMEDHLVIACVRHHHERYDGKGYPDGLQGELIPILARIVCVADAYHAMVSTRSYRKGMPIDHAIEQLEQGAGSQFDPEIVGAFVESIRRSS